MVRIVTDSTAGLPADVAGRYQIPIIPQLIVFGSDSYLEGVEMDNATFMRRLAAARELPKTAAPPPELFTREFERLVPLGEPILCIHPSAELSGTVRSATLAARDFPGADIRIVDTRVIGSPLATMVTLAAEWAAAGCTMDTLVARVEDLVGRARVYFVVATLRYLALGGRIGGAAALVGSLLQVKPILALRDGRVQQVERERSQRRAVARLKEMVLAEIPMDGTAHLSVMHAAAPLEAQALADDLGAQLHLGQVPILDVPPAIVTHGGPGVLAASFFVSAPRG
jgi:DegV family protein with EDD domain